MISVRRLTTTVPIISYTYFVLVKISYTLHVTLGGFEKAPSLELHAIDFQSFNANFMALYLIC